MNEKYKFPIFIGINGRMENCSSGLLGVIVRNTFHFIPVVPLLALKIRKDLSEIASWLGPTKKGMGLFGHLDPSSRQNRKEKKERIHTSQEIESF